MARRRDVRGGGPTHAPRRSRQVAGACDIGMCWPGLQPESFGHSLDQVILGHRGADLDDAQS